MIGRVAHLALREENGGLVTVRATVVVPVDLGVTSVTKVELLLTTGLPSGVVLVEDQALDGEVAAMVLDQLARIFLERFMASSFSCPLVRRAGHAAPAVGSVGCSMSAVVPENWYLLLAVKALLLFLTN